MSFVSSLQRHQSDFLKLADQQNKTSITFQVNEISKRRKRTDGIKMCARLLLLLAQQSSHRPQTPPLPLPPAA